MDLWIFFSKETIAMILIIEVTNPHALVGTTKNETLEKFEAI